MAAETELVLLARQVLHVDDDLAASRRRGGMLAGLDLGDDDLVGQVHQRMTS